MQESSKDAEIVQVHKTLLQLLSSRKKIIILTGISLLLIVSFIVLFVGFIQKQKMSSKQSVTLTPFPQETKALYKNEYWGFAVKYPKSFHMYQAPSGLNYFFDSYPSDENKDLWYLPKTNELQIRIRISTDNKNKHIEWSKLEGFIKEEAGPTIDGEKSKIVYQKTSLSNYEIDNNQIHNIAQSFIDKGRYKIIYVLTHNDITYEISAEPANSRLLPQFKQFIEDFSLIKRTTYKQVTNKPPTGKLYHQDINLGFIFEYPKDMICKEDMYVCVLTKKNDTSPLASYIRIDLVDNIYNDYENFEKNIAHYASNMCAADGPGGSMYCPEEDIVIQSFKNKKGVTGYKVQRKLIHAKYVGESKEIVETKNDFIIFYKIDAHDTFAVVFSNDSHELDGELIDIANSFHSLQRKN